MIAYIIDCKLFVHYGCIGSIFIDAVFQYIYYNAIILWELQ